MTSPLRASAGVMLDQIRAINAELRALPEPIAYIVLDHAAPVGRLPEQRDAQGRKYVRCSPSLLDAVVHIKPEADGRSFAQRLSGIPVYRREDMPEGWPDA